MEEDEQPSKEHYKYTKNRLDMQILHTLFATVLSNKLADFILLNSWFCMH